MVRYGFTRGKDGLIDSEDAMSPKPKPKPVNEEQQVIAGADENPSSNETITQVDQRAFRDGYEPAEGDVFIAVLGVTGAGKSTFISKCTDKEVSIGHNLQACTQEVGVFLCKHRGVNVYLIDTPGFDDTDRSDTEVSCFAFLFCSGKVTIWLGYDCICRSDLVHEERVTRTLADLVDLISGPPRDRFLAYCILLESGETQWFAATSPHHRSTYARLWHA